MGWRGGGVRGGGGVVGGGKKPKESGVKFDAEIPSQIPRAAVGRHAAAAVQQSQHKLHNIPLNSPSQPDLSLISLNKESDFGLLFRVLRYHYGSKGRWEWEGHKNHDNVVFG